MRDSYEDKYKDWKSKKERENARATAPKQTPNIYASKPVEQKSTFREQKQPAVVKEERIPQRMMIEDKKSGTYYILIALAFLIPIFIIGYIIYLNYLPFGPGDIKTISIDNGSIEGRVPSFYLQSMDGKKLSSVTLPYDQVFLVIKPRADLINTRINITLTGDNVLVASPISFNPDIYKWDLRANLSKGIPSYFNGSAQYDSRNECVSFVRNSSLYMPETYDKFEKGPFMVYAVWTPSESNKSFQQIIGHYNWELIQDKNSVKFQIGRVNAVNQTLKNLSGPLYTAKYVTDEDFFNKIHQALAIYMPSKKGYIELWIDNQLAERVSIGGDSIWEDYNGGKPLSLGKSEHGSAEYYQGCISQVAFANNVPKLYGPGKDFLINDTLLKIPLVINKENTIIRANLIT